MMFERYTERARRALFFARYEASELGSTSIDCEHLLLGVVREDKGAGLTSRILSRHGLTYPSLRDAIKATGKKFPTAVEIPFSSSAKTVLQAAAGEADRLHHSYIGTEHLLLGILSEGKSGAAAVLTTHGLDLDGARAEVLSLLQESPGSAYFAEPPPATATWEFTDGVIYYAAASVDGFTATADEGLAWLEPFRETLDNIGYASFHGSIDAMILGSFGFAHLLGFEAHARPAWMLSNGTLKPAGPDAVATSETPVELVTELGRRGYRRIWLVGGAAIAATLREADLITVCVVSVIPVILGGGIPLFGNSAATGPARLIYSRAHAQGIVQNCYLVKRKLITRSHS